MSERKPKVLQHSKRKRNISRYFISLLRPNKRKLRPLPDHVHFTEEGDLRSYVNFSDIMTGAQFKAYFKKQNREEISGENKSVDELLDIDFEVVEITSENPADKEIGDQVA